MTRDALGTGALDFVVRRDAIATTEFLEAPDPQTIDLAPSEVLLRVDRFAFTANNITYATFGDLMSYWSFFPAPDGWGRVPVWGFADVVRSAADGIAPGERWYGYLPMSTHLLVQATRVDEAGFVDGAGHRAGLPAFYNRYTRTASDPGYDPEREAEQMLLRPLFATAFLIDDLLAENAFNGAQAVILSSASSKTAYATAFQLAQREDVEVIGLTSPGNVAFVERLGCYDRVVAYDAVDTLPAGMPVAYVDMSGSAAVRSAVHHHFAQALRSDTMVGATHHDEITGAADDLPGPAPELFFAPARAAKRLEDWGPAGMQERIGTAWTAFAALLADPQRRPLQIVEGHGPQAVQQVYLDALEGRLPPDEGHILSLHA